jgi:hypothetical protein
MTSELNCLWVPIMNKNRRSSDPGGGDQMRGPTSSGAELSRAPSEDEERFCKKRATTDPTTANAIATHPATRGDSLDSTGAIVAAAAAAERREGGTGDGISQPLPI